MTKPMVKIHNTETDEVIEREMNDDEFAQYKIDQEKQAAERAEIETNATAKADLLAKIGITAEEAALLLS